MRGTFQKVLPSYRSHKLPKTLCSSIVLRNSMKRTECVPQFFHQEPVVPEEHCSGPDFQSYSLGLFECSVSKKLQGRDAFCNREKTFCGSLRTQGTILNNSLVVAACFQTTKLQRLLTNTVSWTAATRHRHGCMLPLRVETCTTTASFLENNESPFDRVQTVQVNTSVRTVPFTWRDVRSHPPDRKAKIGPPVDLS